MLEYSQHAEDRLSKRKILKTRIVRTVFHPDEIVQSFRGRKVRRKRYGDKLLEVVTITEGNKIIVITGYYKGEADEN